MSLESIQAPSAASRWTSRLAAFALMVLLTAAMLHKLFGMPTPVAFNLAKVAIAGALASLVLGVVAAAGIWANGRPGAARVVVGITLSLAMLALPLLVMAMSRDYPDINDVTTDFNEVPAFQEIARQRGPGTNDPSYPGERFSRQQMRAYPDLVPLTINRSLKEAFEVAADAIKRQGLEIVSERAPAAAGEPGMIEAVDRTLLLGFYDDVVVRVSGNDETARVDIRSASRFGRNDMGQNAERMRDLMKEMVVRLEETVSAAEADKKDADKKGRPGVKKGQEDDPRSARRRRLRDRALSGARREQAPKAKPPARVYDPGQGIQPGRSFE
jgi:uncharacterized protein (DUF1499 family)